MRFAGKVCALSVIATLLGLVQFAQAQHKPKDAECLACHSDQTLTTDVNGRKVSLYIDAGKMKQSVHGGTFACVDCHKDVKSSPHAETPAKVACVHQTGGGPPCGQASSKPVSREMPSRCGPRHCGQSAATAD